METQLICTICGYTGEANKKARGNGFIEFILWWFFLVPGIIYSIWSRGGSGKNVCPKCGSTTMIPVNTPIGQKLASEYRNNPNVSNASLPEQKSNNGRNIMIGVVVVVLIVLAVAISIAMDDVNKGNDNYGQPVTKQNEPVVQNLPTEPQARIESIIKSIGDYEVTLWDAKENLAKSTTPPPYEVVVIASNGKIAGCSYAKNIAFEIMKKLYTDSVVKDKISRVKFTSWGHLSVSVGGEDGRKTDWNSSGPTNFWTVIMKYKPYEDETGKLNQRTWGKEIANNCD